MRSLPERNTICSLRRQPWNTGLPCERRPRLAVTGAWGLAIACCLAAAALPGSAQDVSGLFPSAPADSLITKAELVTDDDAGVPAIEVAHKFQRLDDVDAVRIEATVTNTGDAPVAAREIPVLDLTFELHERQEDAPYSRLTYRDQEWYDSTFWTGPGWTRVGKDWHHPGENTPSVRCFRAPRDGRITIGGAVRKYHLDGDGVRVMIRHGEQEVWRAEIDGKDATGVEPALTLDVQRGDRVRFIVHKRGAISCDTTYWDPTITYADGESFRASEGFSTKRQGESGWFYEMQSREGPGPQTALTYRNQEWYGSTFWTGPDWTRVGKDWHHPGEDTPSVRRFQLPRDGRVAVAGRVFKLHEAGDGVRLLIKYDEREVWRAEIDGADATGVDPNLSLDVEKGHSLRFIVHKRGSISCDTTHWDPVVTYPDGERFQASESFSANTQGEGGWFYEMLVGDLPSSPTVRGLGPDLTLREMALSESRAFRATADSALPFLVLSDALDETGIMLALDATSRWSFAARLTPEGDLRATLSARTGALAPGESRLLPAGFIGTYGGPWTASLSTLKAITASGDPGESMGALREGIERAYQTAAASLERAPDLDLLLMAQSEWHHEDGIEEKPDSYGTAVGAHLQKTGALLEALQDDLPAAYAARAGQRLARLEQSSKEPGHSLRDWRALYLRTRLLKREIALSNPLLSFGELLFCKRLPPAYSHLVMQYYGWRARPKGSLFVLKKPGVSLACRDILHGQLPAGCVLEPRLSYDGKRIVFSFVECREKPFTLDELVVNEEGPDAGYYHIYEVNVDGTGLRQLTRGPYDDTMPTYLPDGGIAFCSTRRKGYSRCFGAQFSRRWDSYTVHRMDADGANIRALSFNDVSEWFPTVSNSGHLIYARWDYIDRDAVTHQNLWAMHPDGTNPVSVWGNASPKPHCMFQAQPVPGSNKIVFTASAHHTITGGPLGLLSPGIDPNDLSAVERLTPGPFPEVEGWNVPGYYNSPWPLSEDYFLVAYSPTPLISEGKGPNLPNALGLYLLDRAGNRELIYRDPQIGSANPTPLTPRPVPPVIASALPKGAPPTGEVTMLDVYQGLGDVPRGTIKQIRVIQIFPKTTPLANQPPIGLAGEENGRAILGTVSVEADGSARFEVPARKPILFQALDENGFAYQTMRSLTYLQPGEKTSCIGCHEPQVSAPPNRRALAPGRRPSQLDPGELGGEPFSFMRVVQPVLDKHCIRCHSGSEPPMGIDLTGTPRDGFTRSYWSLCGDGQQFWGGNTNPQNAAEALVPRFGARNTIQMTPPGGMYGALGSRLIKLLRAGHHDTNLTSAEFRRLGAWIDCNAIFYGVYDPVEQAKQLAGETVDMPAVQ